jgi:hypothetical protein
MMMGGPPMGAPGIVAGGMGSSGMGGGGGGGGGGAGAAGPKNPGIHKTKLCERFMTTGQCPYGQKCTFAHG